VDKMKLWTVLCRKSI